MFQSAEAFLEAFEGGGFSAVIFLDGRSAGLPHDMVHDNRFDGKTIKAKDSYRSTKHSGKGTGLTSIAAAAEKYGGV